MSGPVSTNDSASTSAGRGIEWLRRGCLLLGSCIVALGLAEATVRALGLAPEVVVIQKGRYQLSANPKIGYEPAPLDYDGEVVPFFDYQGSSNRLGYRDTDHEFEKPDGTYRILLLGDSIGAGLKIERYDDIFGQVMVRELEEAGAAVELINLCVSGYNTQQEVETLRERGLGYDPDLVLLQYCLNDRYLDNGMVMAELLEQEISERRIPSVRLQPLLVHSAFLRLVRFRVEPYRRQGLADIQPLHGEIEGDTVAASLLDLRELADRHGFDVLVAIFPAMAEPDRPYPYADQHAWLVEHLDGLNLAWYDLLPDMRDCPVPEGGVLSFDIVHPTEPGHRCAGEALAREIGRRFELPRL